MAVNVSKQLHGWIDSLKNSQIKGVKFLTEREKARFVQKQEQEDFDREMAEFRTKHADWLIRRQSDPNAQL